MRRSEWWPTLSQLADDQSGLITAAQARQAGASRKQLADLADQGTLIRLQHGVYQVAGAPADRWIRIRSAWLAIDPERSAPERLATDDPQGVVSHRSAAHLLDLGDVDADRIEFITRARRRPRDPDVLIHRGHLGRPEWTIEHGIPVTTPLVTVRSLAVAGIDREHLAGVVRDAVWRHDVPVPELAAALDTSAPDYGSRNGSELVDDLLSLAGVPQSSVDLAVIAASDAIRDGLAIRAQELARRFREQVSPTVDDLQMSLADRRQAAAATALAPAFETLAATISRGLAEPLEEAAKSQIQAALTTWLQEAGSHGERLPITLTSNDVPVDEQERMNRPLGPSAPTDDK